MGLLVIYALRFYTNKLKVENDLLLEKKTRQQEHDMHEEKLRFFTNITHELRSPMTLILGVITSYSIHYTKLYDTVINVL